MGLEESESFVSVLENSGSSRRNGALPLATTISYSQFRRALSQEPED
jgi:hypothetical protein